MRGLSIFGSTATGMTYYNLVSWLSTRLARYPELNLTRFFEGDYIGVRFRVILNEAVCKIYFHVINVASILPIGYIAFQPSDIILTSYKRKDQNRTISNLQNQHSLTTTLMPQTHNQGYTYRSQRGTS